MITFLAVMAAIGLACGLWQEFSEQRRLRRAAAVTRGTSITDGDSSGMARDCRRKGDSHE
ncbi:hypothetical protein [Desulfovibrio sp. 6_1_46AFAA]|uniref:hypothetical protein n=1 Tax=Desulfovibrio sp. 6_1_46AFAA TaxID=665942 RepID=UPI000309E45F|nr:hypothetical protein [Desulfovibrio sp. 6_1_46AFAA]